MCFVCSAKWFCGETSHFLWSLRGGWSPNIWWPRNRFYGEVVGGAMGRPGVGWLLSIMGWWRGSVEYYGGHTLSLAWVSRCWTHTRNPLTGGGSPLVGWWNKTGVAIFLQNIGETVLFWSSKKATKAAIGYIYFLQFSLSENIIFFTMEVGYSITFPQLSSST